MLFSALPSQASLSLLLRPAMTAFIFPKIKKIKKKCIASSAAVHRAAAAAPCGRGLVSACTRRGQGKDWICQSASALRLRRAPVPRPLPHSHSLMGSGLTTDPNCLWAALHVLLVPDCFGSCQQATGSRERIATAIAPLFAFMFMQTNKHPSVYTFTVLSFWGPHDAGVSGEYSPKLVNHFWRIVNRILRSRSLSGDFILINLIGFSAQLHLINDECCIVESTTMLR